MFNQKGYVAVLVIILGLILILGIFKVSQKQNSKTIKMTQPVILPSTSPSPDIKLDKSGDFYSYTNHTENFSLSYPKGWKVRENPKQENGEGVVILYPPQSIPENSPFAARLQVYVLKPNPRTEAKESESDKVGFEKEYLKPISDGKGLRNFKIGNTTIAGQKAIIEVERSLEGDQTESYYSQSTSFPYGIFYYSIKMLGSEEEEVKKYLGDYDKILASFKLLGPKPTVTPITLKTYTNEKLGFSFEYPSNWLVNTFQNNGDFNKGFTVVNEDDEEILTMYQEGRYGASCKEIAPVQKNVLFGENKVDIKFDCDHPRVKTKSGKEFAVGLYVFGSESEQDGLKLLKSIKGLTVID